MGGERENRTRGDDAESKRGAQRAKGEGRGVQESVGPGAARASKGSRGHHGGRLWFRHQGGGPKGPPFTSPYAAEGGCLDMGRRGPRARRRGIARRHLHSVIVLSFSPS